MHAIRRQNIDLLTSAGFYAAPNLPCAGLDDPASWRVRQPIAIASRLMALDALFTWGALPHDSSPTDRVRDYSDRNSLREFMPPAERAVFDLDRMQAHAEHVDTVGWKLENMWPLAWALGFEPAPEIGGTISTTMSEDILFRFLPGLDATVSDLLERSKPRCAREMVVMEDLFYCAHNAARSAQLGGKTVPRGFHPIVDGGAIHERRHSLTWCISPQTHWDDTDLST